jgi:calcineurin-like phosphoesterase family protein
MKYYIISDTHLGHAEIIGYCGRPDNHEKLIVESMNLISDRDCLIHLGDICIGNDSDWHDCIKHLKCRKILTKGNHDSKSYSWYMEHGWDFVCDVFKLKYCGKIICFSHKPQPWDGDWEINIHGHLHNLGHRDNEYKNLKQWHRLYAPELMGYRPIELSKFIQSKPAKDGRE